MGYGKHVVWTVVIVVLVIMSTLAIGGGLGYGQGYAQGWLEGQVSKGVHFHMDFGGASLHTGQKSADLKPSFTSKVASGYGYMGAGDVISGELSAVAETFDSGNWQDGEQVTFVTSYFSSNRSCTSVQTDNPCWNWEGAEVQRSDGSRHVFPANELWRFSAMRVPVGSRVDGKDS